MDITKQYLWYVANLARQYGARYGDPSRQTMHAFAKWLEDQDEHRLPLDLEPVTNGSSRKAPWQQALEAEQSYSPSTRLR